MKLNSLDQIKYLEISTSPEDLRNRIELIFDLMGNDDEPSPVEYASAFSDVIGYSSYAGNIPDDTQAKLIKWIVDSFNAKDLEFANAAGSCLCFCNSKLALKAIEELISESLSSKVKEILIGYRDEITPNK